MRHIKLGVNIDHVATLRQARQTTYPCPIEAALLCEQAGADGITLHLREDRRHIQDADVSTMRPKLSTPMNLEIALTPFMVDFARSIKPDYVCLVPEKREELTTEGGLDVIKQLPYITEVVRSLNLAGINVSLFIDADLSQIDAAIASGAQAIELHTGAYADASGEAQQLLLQQLSKAAEYAATKLIVNAGHGLTRDNVAAIARIPQINELNIGHAIIADSIFMGLAAAVVAMRTAIDSAIAQ